MDKKIFLFIKPRKIENVPFMLGKEASNMKDSDEIFEDELAKGVIKLEEYIYLIDLCPADKNNELFTMIQNRAKKFRENIHFINDDDMKYVQFDYYSLFETPTFFSAELRTQNRIVEKQQEIMDFITKMYNNALKIKEDEGDTQTRRLALGVKLNNYLNSNAKKEIILVGDDVKIVDKPNTEYVKLKELTVIGMMTKMALEMIRAE